MFTFQENTHFSQALPCTKEAFWEQVKKQTTASLKDRGCTRPAVMAQQLGISEIRPETSEPKEEIRKGSLVQEDGCRKAESIRTGSQGESASIHLQLLSV